MKTCLQARSYPSIFLDRCQSQNSSINCQDAASNKTQGDILLLCPHKQIRSRKQWVDKKNRNLRPTKNKNIWTNIMSILVILSAWQCIILYVKEKWDACIRELRPCFSLWAQVVKLKSKKERVKAITRVWKQSSWPLAASRCNGISSAHI